MLDTCTQQDTRTNSNYLSFNIHKKYYDLLKKSNYKGHYGEIKGEGGKKHCILILCSAYAVLPDK